MQKSFSRAQDSAKLEVQIGFGPDDFNRVFKGGKNAALLAKISAPDFGDLDEAAMAAIVGELATVNAAALKAEEDAKKKG